ncbi:MAG: hypothetical protein U5L45_00300 [Saprospiraceae bacterium]|nr:hypothetical protein [Saprospiraceae bacterium]
MNENEETAEMNAQNLMFKVFGFVDNKARRHLIVFLLVFFGFVAVISVCYAFQTEKRMAREKQEIINKYESKIDTLYNRVIKLSVK